MSRRKSVDDDATEAPASQCVHLSVEEPIPAECTVHEEARAKITWRNDETKKPVDRAPTIFDRLAYVGKGEGGNHRGQKVSKLGAMRA
jgi:hypothetical protein